MSFDLAVLSPLAERPFGFQDAWVAAFSPPDAALYAQHSFNTSTLLLNDKGCGVPQHDCTTACQDPLMVWSDMNAMYTMQNCMAYPVISLMLTEGNLSTSAQDTVRDFNIVDSNSIDLKKIVGTINGCIDQYCQQGYCLSAGACAVELYSNNCFSPLGVNEGPPTCEFLRQVSGDDPPTDDDYSK